MQEDSQTIGQIEKYILGEMTASESGDFEKRLASDLNLASETELRYDLIKSIRKAGESDLEKTISEVRSKLAEEGFFNQKEAVIRPMKSNRNWLKYAAAIAVLIAATFLFFDWQEKQNIQTAIDMIQFESLPETEEILDSLTSWGAADDDGERKEKLNDINELAQTQSIEEIKKAFEGHIEYYPRDGVAKLLYGEALLKKNLPKEAINQLKSLSDNEEFLHQNLAKLNLAKAYFILGGSENVEAAKALLLSLSLQKDEHYSNQAKQILEFL